MNLRESGSAGKGAKFVGVVGQDPRVFPTESRPGCAGPSYSDCGSDTRPVDVRDPGDIGRQRWQFGPSQPQIEPSTAKQVPADLQRKDSSSGRLGLGPDAPSGSDGPGRRARNGSRFHGDNSVAGTDPLDQRVPAAALLAPGHIHPSIRSCAPFGLNKPESARRIDGQSIN